MNLKSIAYFLVLTLSITIVYATELSSVPGPDDQGGMIMSMVTIEATAGDASNPTAGIIHINFSPLEYPILKPLTEWSLGDWFKDTAAWRYDISPVVGSVVGMPAQNAGNGDIFNNQYGFMFMSMVTSMMANVPTGNSLAIRLDSINTLDLKSFNYGNATNRWDQVFEALDSQVLWNGTMWHNYFTLPNTIPPGRYSATFEIFVADTAFTGGTGFVQYDLVATTAGRNTNFTSSFVTYQFDVIPEPSTIILSGLGIIICLWINRMRKGFCAIS